jgi:hypothetical protein
LVPMPTWAQATGISAASRQAVITILFITMLLVLAAKVLAGNMADGRLYVNDGILYVREVGKTGSPQDRKTGRRKMTGFFPDFLTPGLPDY